MITVVMVRQGEPPAVESIDVGLEAMQAAVGGFIEVVFRPGMPPGVTLIANGDGIAEGLGPNGCGILGPYFFVRWNADGEACSLTDADVAAVRAFYAAYRHQSHPSEYGGETFRIVRWEGGD